MTRKSLILAAVSGLVCVSSVQAASLQVSPVGLDITAPTRNASVTLSNKSSEPADVQIRVFKWTQIGGEDHLTPATDVIVSPPAAKVQPNTAYTIRVAQLKAPSKDREESYRLWIDELPHINVRRRGGSITFTSRYSIPVFFSDPSASTDLQWKVKRQGKKLVVEATNKGTRHAKIANLTAATTGARVSFGTGLNGYVLPGSTVHWTANAGSIQAGSNVKITATGDDYAVDQAATVSGR